MLAQDEYPRVRRVVARNPNIPIEMLQNFLHDENYRVLE
jgi:hypothetical protein